jgi:ABC-type dipeptide/oligopeptide/nickel transport system ATPase component
MTLLEIEGLQTQFRTARGVVKAVDNVDLSIERGGIVGLVGESGSGKSVLADSVLGTVEEPGKIVGGDTGSRASRSSRSPNGSSRGSGVVTSPLSSKTR